MASFVYLTPIASLGRPVALQQLTNNLGKANFVVTLDHEGGRHCWRRNKVAVFNYGSDVIFSERQARELGNAVKDACQAMLKSRK